MAIAKGMRTLLDDGVRRALAGVTTLDDVLRVARLEALCRDALLNYSPQRRGGAEERRGSAEALTAPCATSPDELS